MQDLAPEFQPSDFQSYYSGALITYKNSPCIVGDLQHNVMTDGSARFDVRLAKLSVESLTKIKYANVMVPFSQLQNWDSLKWPTLGYVAINNYIFARVERLSAKTHHKGISPSVVKIDHCINKQTSMVLKSGIPPEKLLLCNSEEFFKAGHYRTETVLAKLWHNHFVSLKQAIKTIQEGRALGKVISRGLAAAVNITKSEKTHPVTLLYQGFEIAHVSLTEPPILLQDVDLAAILEVENAHST